MTVLVAGDANVDLVLRGDVIPRFGQAEQLLDRADLVLGGSSSIVACGLGSLGVPVALAAVVGDDEFGAFTIAALARRGVEIGAVRVDASVPTGISVILSTPDDRAILTLPGAIPRLEAADVRRALAATRARILHVGSVFLMPGLAAELPELLRDARAAGVMTTLDTNWDPAGRWGRIERVLPHVDVLFPNRSELRAIVSAIGLGSGDDRQLALELARLGPRVVVKAGADGAWSVDRSGVVARAEGLRVDVVDTTGAGDSFDAGYLAAVAAGVDDEAERLRWATYCGSLSTRASGGTAAQPTQEELSAWLGSAPAAGG